MTDNTAPPVTLYSQPGCGPCVGVESYLKASKIPHQVRDIREDPAAFDRIVELGHTGTPVIEYPGGHFKGYDPRELAIVKEAFAMV